MWEVGVGQKARPNFIFALISISESHEPSNLTSTLSLSTLLFSLSHDSWLTPHNFSIYSLSLSLYFWGHNYPCTLFSILQGRLLFWCKGKHMHTPSAILCVTSESKLFTCHSLQLHICRLSHALVSSRYFVSYLYKNKVGPHRRTHLDRIRWSLSISVSLASGTRCLLLLHLPCSNQICTFLCFIVKQIVLIFFGLIWTMTLTGYLLLSEGF